MSKRGVSLQLKRHAGVRVHGDSRCSFPAELGAAALLTDTQRRVKADRRPDGTRCSRAGLNQHILDVFRVFHKPLSVYPEYK